MTTKVNRNLLLLYSLKAAAHGPTIRYSNINNLKSGQIHYYR